MTRIKSNTLGAILAAIISAFSAAQALAIASKGAADLVPHRAVYEMTLDETRPASGITGVQGRMVFEFAGSDCDGYTMNMRLVTRVEGEVGGSIVTDLRSSTWEQGAGKRYRFNTSHYKGDKLEETTSGDAEREEGDGDVEVHVSAPEPRELKVSGPVLFPTQHSLAILEAARQSKSVLQTRVYDGSSKGDKVYVTTTFIGKRLKAGAKQPDEPGVNDSALAKLDSWPISISYFDIGEEATETPVYQLSFRLYDNGVSRDLLIDYGDFAIKGDLSSLELMPFSRCD